jgi:hypothetical protein
MEKSQIQLIQIISPITLKDCPMIPLRGKLFLAPIHNFGQQYPVEIHRISKIFLLASLPLLGQEIPSALD